MKKSYLLILTFLSTVAPFFAHADEICLANKDSALFADAALSQEDRIVFQFDGVQFVPETKSADTLWGWAYDTQMQQLLETPSYVRAADWNCESFPDFKAETHQTGGASAALVYDVSPEACAQELSDTRIEITDHAFTFYESSCDIGEVSQQDGGDRYELSCYGEGDSWTINALLMPLPDNGMRFTIDGNSSDYISCRD